MKIANARLIVSVGNDVPVENITPAEAAILVRKFCVRAKGMPLARLVEVGEVTRSNSLEVRRLASVYGLKIVKELFPGMDPRLPETFAEAMEMPQDVTQEEHATLFGTKEEIDAAVKAAHAAV